MIALHDLPDLASAEQALETAVERLTELRKLDQHDPAIAAQVAAQDLTVRKYKVDVLEAELDSMEDEDSPAAHELRRRLVDETATLVENRRVFAEKYPTP